jgi:PUA-domain protein
VPTRTILKDRDSKPLIETLRKLGGDQSLSHKSRVELETVRDAEIIFVDGQPFAFQRKGELIPVLVNDEVLSTFPKIVVDMGAVPHVAGGADIMAPGIRRVQGDFASLQLVVIVDEKHDKHLAVGRSLLDSEVLKQTKKGKVIENLHYVGDTVWEVVKGFAHPLHSKT